MNTIDLFIICGATASGKTDLALALSDYLPIEIISADSRQIYKFMNIGTAKPSISELNRVPHHFIDIVNPDEYYSAGIFEKQADKVITDILGRRRIPVIVGGSGLYIKALCDGFFDDDTDNEEFIKLRTELENELREKGKFALYNELLKIDIASAEKYNDMNPRRIIRALAYYRLTGIPFSVSHKEQMKNKNYNCHYFAIDMPRDVLYDRINKRSLLMWQNGLLRETINLLEMGYSENLNSLNTVGYKETLSFIKGQLNEFETINKIQQNTRHYAKRQLTWFRNQYENIHWLSSEPGKNVKAVVNYIKNLTEY